MFLNTAGDRAGVDDKLANVLDYIKTGESNDDYTKELDERVREMNEDDDWRDKHMTFGMKLDQTYENGYTKGEISGELKMIYKLVSEGTITVGRGVMEAKAVAGKSEMTVEELIKAMTEAGYKLPEE